MNTMSFSPAKGFTKPRFVQPDSDESGFTFIETLVSLGILGLIFGVSVVAFRPAELAKRARDLQRLADINALSLAIESYVANVSTPDLDGPNNTNSGVDENQPRIYTSIPSDQETISLSSFYRSLVALRQRISHSTKFLFAEVNDDACAGNDDDDDCISQPRPLGDFTFGQVPSALIAAINGSGWAPINFGTVQRSIITQLPADPINSYAKRLFYSYVFKRGDSTFELQANLESAQLSSGGKDDREARDGGDNIALYERGTNLKIFPTGFY